MKKYFFLITFFLISFCNLGQYHTETVSYKEFKNETDLHKKTEIGYLLRYEFELNDLDSLKLLSTELLLIGKENNFEYAFSMGEFGLGSYFLRKGEFEKSQEYLRSSLLFFKTIEDYKIVSEILNEIGNCYSLSGEYTNAIQSYISSMDFGAISKDETAAFSGEIGLAKVYFSLGDTLKGESTLNRFIKSCVKYEKYKSISNAYSYFGMIEQDKGNQEESMNYLDKSIFFGLKSDSKLQVSHVYTNKAIMFFSVEQYDSSLIFFQKALKLREELNRPRQICESYFNLASFYIERGEMDTAISEVRKSIVIAKNNSLIQDEFDGVELLEYIYGEMKDTVTMAKQTVLLKDLKIQLSKKNELNEEQVSYIDEIEVSIPEGQIVSNSEEDKSWMLIAGAVIIVLAGGVIGKSFFS